MEQLERQLKQAKRIRNRATSSIIRICRSARPNPAHLDAVQARQRKADFTIRTTETAIEQARKQWTKANEGAAELAAA
jgi:hypothetical protein